MKTNKWLVGCVIGCLALLVLSLLGGFLAYRYWLKPSMDKMLGKSEEIGPPRVVQGAGLLSQTVFLSDSALGPVTDIAFGQLDPSPGATLGVAGADSAAFLDARGKAISRVTFAKHWDRINFVDVDGDGVCEFMNRGSAGYDAALLDHQGRTRWHYQVRGDSVNDMAAGDVDGDGRREFAVGFMGKDGVHLLDAAGEPRWRRPDTLVWSVAMADINRDGRAEIVHSNGRGQLTIRDGRGDAISQTKLTPTAAPTAPFTLGFFHFSLCHWPKQTSPPLALTAGRDTVEAFDLKGRSQARFDAPRASFLSDVMGVPVKLRAKEPEYFATVVTFQLADRSVLYVYNANRGLIYEEVLPEICHALAVRPAAHAGEETLLVGGEGKVYEYRAAGAPTAASSR